MLRKPNSAARRPAAARLIRNWSSRLTDSSKGHAHRFFSPDADATGNERVCGGSALEYHGLEGQLVFRGDESRRQTALGLVVSVVLKPNADAGGLDFALISRSSDLGGEAHQDFTWEGSKPRTAINPAGAENSPT